MTTIAQDIASTAAQMKRNAPRYRGGACCSYGDTTYYAARSLGWRETKPYGKGDASNPMRIFYPKARDYKVR